MHKKTLVALVFLAISSTAQADVYDYKDSAGKIAYQETPHQSKANKKKIKVESRNSNEQWTLIQKKDEMTDEQQCVIESPAKYVGKQGDEFLFVSIRVTTTKQGDFIVGLYSSAPLSSREIPPSFHNDFEGLGIRVDSQPFVAVNIKVNQQVLGFDLASSKLIVSQLSSGVKARVRVRFWPYDQTLDGDKIALSDFKRALQSLLSCKDKSVGANKSIQRTRYAPR